MKIKSITAVITNSSNETFITKVYPDPEIYHYSDAVPLTWEMITSGDIYPFDYDVLVTILEDSNVTLVDNCFPKSHYSDTPWETHLSYGDMDYIRGLWQMFVQENEEAFKTLVGICYVYGLDDNEVGDWDTWHEWNDDLGEISLYREGR